MQLNSSFLDTVPVPSYPQSYGYYFSPSAAGQVGAGAGAVMPSQPISSGVDAPMLVAGVGDTVGGGGRSGGGSSVAPATFGAQPSGGTFDPAARQSAATPGMNPGAVGAESGAATPTPLQNTQGKDNSGIGNGIANSFKAIGDMISNYQTLGAVQQSEVAATPPTMRVTPQLATFGLPVIQSRV